MKTIEINLYKYDELSEDAKQRAREWYANGDIYHWHSENQETLKTFEKVFPIKVYNWSYGGNNYGISFSFIDDDEVRELTGQRLATFIWNNYRNEIYSKKYYSKGHKHRHSKFQIESGNCPFTGYCVDNSILDPIFEFMNKPDNRDFEDLMRDCLNNWLSACNEDVEYTYTKEAIEDSIRANEYDFTKDGEIF